MHPAPHSPRDWLSLFATLEPPQDLDALLARIDWSGTTPLRVYFSLYGTVPGPEDSAAVATARSARDLAGATLLSPRFQAGICEHLLRALPEKRRLIFVHIPKCAGTDLIDNFGRTLPRLYEDLAKPHWISGEDFFSYLCDFSRSLAENDSIFVHGHVPLSWYLERNLCRPQDRVFTTIRDPLELMISQVNYVFKRFFESPMFNAPDAREWADMLGLQMFDRDLDASGIRQLALRILRDTRIVPPNYICSYLGHGTARSALEAVRASNIEITDVTRYPRWLQETWGCTATRANRSQPILTVQDLDPADRAYLEAASREDAEFYGRAIEALRATRKNSIFGTELFSAVP